MRVEHVALYVNDPEAARDFFVSYLGGRSDDGYRNRTTGFRSFFIRFDDGALFKMQLLIVFSLLKLILFSSINIIKIQK